MLRSQTMHPQPVSPGLERLGRRLPVELHPTNLPGAYTSPAPSADFDPNRASVAALMKQGLLWKRPQKDDPPSLRTAWDRVFARQWLAEDRIVPVLEPQAGQTHRLRGLIKTADPGYTSSNWSGGVMQGQWATVVGYWSVPTVSRPPEPLGPDGGWNSSSWIGIDGFSSSDALQAGIQQRVAPDGEAQYVAWYEWFTPQQAGSPAYIWQTNITNFPIGPGQQVFCSLQYINDKAAGQLYFANDATGQHLSLTLAPPPGANFAGDSIEWIMEAAYGLPAFTPVRFASAIGCGADRQTVANPHGGDYINIVCNNKILTSVALANDEVTVTFAG